MPLFGGDEANKRYKEAKKYGNVKKKEFDLDRAIRLLEEAISLKPNSKYFQKLEELRQLKDKSESNLSLRVLKAFPEAHLKGVASALIYGKVEQGSIRKGDELVVRIGDITSRVKIVDLNKPKGFAASNEDIMVILEGEDRIGEGDVIEGVIAEEEPKHEEAIAPSRREIRVQKSTVYESRGQGYVEVPYSQILIEHTGNVPCVVELPLNHSPKLWLGWGVFFLSMCALTQGCGAYYGSPFFMLPYTIMLLIPGVYCLRRSRRSSKRFESLNGIKLFAKDVYVEWKGTAHLSPLKIPKKVKIRGRKVSTELPKTSISLAKEWAKRVFDIPNVHALECSRWNKPSVRIEPKQVRWSRKRGKPEEIEKAKEILVSMAERIEEQGY